MKIALRIAALIYVPPLLGIAVAVLSFAGYTSLGGNPEIQPFPVELAEYLGMLAAIALPGFLAWPAFKDKRFALFLLIAVLAVPYTWVREAHTSQELLSYLGYSCCRESAATLATATEVALNPAAPWLRLVGPERRL